MASLASSTSTPAWADKAEAVCKKQEPRCGACVFWSHAPNKDDGDGEEASLGQPQELTVSGRIEKPEQESSWQFPGQGQGLGSRTILQPQPKAFTVTSCHLIIVSLSGERTESSKGTCLGSRILGSGHRRGVWGSLQWTLAACVGSSCTSESSSCPCPVWPALSRRIITKAQGAWHR